MRFELVTTVDARDLPADVLDYCVENEISTHYNNDIAQVKDDGNVFAEWLKKNGYVFKKGINHIGIIAT